MRTIAGLQQEFYDIRKRLNAMAAQTYTQTGRALIIIPDGATACEASFPVTFWNVFTDQPAFTSGAALDDNQPLTSGSYPTGNACVYTWTTLENASPGKSYTGATLAVVVTGESGQRVWVHYSFTGTALSMPAPAAPTNGTGTA